jgi:hypothetical protein
VNFAVRCRWPLIADTFLHPFAHTGEQMNSGDDPFLPRHPPRLSHFREQGKAGVIGDAVVHGRKLAECAGRSKPELSGDKIH